MQKNPQAEQMLGNRKVGRSILVAGDGALASGRCSIFAKTRCASVLFAFEIFAALGYHPAIAQTAPVSGTTPAPGASAPALKCPEGLELVKVQRLVKISAGRYAVSYDGQHGKGSREESKAEIDAAGLEAGKLTCMLLPSH